VIARAPRTPARTTTPLTVAVYCRKSVDKNKDDRFSSIESQREAVEAYAASQRGNGWVVLPEHFDDNNISGAKASRPAFNRLLEAVRAVRVNIVAVYKLDRLGRSQRNFLAILDEFEKYGVQFVSVTEHFDSTTPMGRFALGILIQVAQLEREVTAERVRDKVAASRRRGLWTGGAVPLGYRSVDKRLVIDEAGADVVRAIVAVYLETGSLTGTLEVLRGRGIVAKGGVAFTVATLRNLLRNPLIGGRIKAGDAVVKAAHEAVLDEPTWTALQMQLARPEKPVRRHRRVRTCALLANLVRCGRCGATMSYQWTGKANGRRYGAYVCQSIIRKGATACPGSRVPAAAFEAHVIEHVRAVSRDPAVLRAAVAAAASELEVLRADATASTNHAKAEVQRLLVEQARMVETVANGNERVPELIERLNAVRAEREAVEQAAAQAKADLGAMKDATINEAELRRDVASFDGAWQYLFPAERQRILGLLIERITMTVGDDGEDVAIQYSSDGARRLLAETTKEAS